LHDHVIPDLSGVGLALDALSGQPDEQNKGGRIDLQSLNHVIQRDLTALRTTLIDLYPPNVAQGGLGEEIARLAHHLFHDDVRVAITWTSQIVPTEDAARLTYRIVREALLNVREHAQAQHVWVTLGQHDDTVEIAVVDDGVGVIPSQLASEGHLGLALLKDLLADLGGHLSLGANHHQGTALQATFKAR
jgi:two-component system, NarL family, sensor kinase